VVAGFENRKEHQEGYNRHQPELFLFRRSQIQRSRDEFSKKTEISAINTIKSTIKVTIQVGYGVAGKGL